MTRKDESKFYDRIRPLLLGLPNTRVRRVEQHSISGDPDLNLCINVWTVDLELKKDQKEKPAPLQLFNLEDTIRAGGYGLLAHPDNWDDVYKFLQRLAYSQPTKRIKVPSCLQLPTRR